MVKRTRRWLKLTSCNTKAKNNAFNKHLGHEVYLKTSRTNSCSATKPNNPLFAFWENINVGYSHNSGQKNSKSQFMIVFMVKILMKKSISP